MEIEGEFIDLIQHEDRVLALDPAQRLKDPTGQRADICPAVTADLGLVTHAAQRGADELAPHGPRDGLSQRSLANAGRADEAQDHAFTLAPDLILRWLLEFLFSIQPQLANCQEFEDAVLDILQAVMVGIQDIYARA